jgi:predicted ATPase/DNA-binding XRE family transcriptional regulator
MLLRSLREACGLTQDRWAAFVGVSRKTVQRWESGDAVPDAAAEAEILALCLERRVVGDGRRPGSVVVSSGEVAEVLAGARAGRGRGPAANPVEPDDANPVDGAASDLVGRRSLLRELHQAVTVSRLVTLTGPGGVGKTSVARAFAATTASTFVELAPVGDHELVGPTIALAIGVRQTRRSSLRDSIVTAIGDRSLLLVLDNFEHVTEASTLVGDLVVSCPRLSLVVTSRRALQVAGEHVLAVPPLPAADAVELFVARAGFDRLVSADDADDVAAICERLDGLPLAIELAAARARLVPPAAMRARLDRAIDLAVGGPATLEDRHRALHTTLQWSYALLEPTAKSCLHALSLFAGDFDLDVAGAVVEPQADLGAIREVINELQLQSLVQIDDGPDGRARLLATIRDFADERADSDPAERAAAVSRYVRWCVESAERAAAQLRGALQHDALTGMSIEIDNLRGGLRRAIGDGDAVAAARLAIALAPWWDLRGTPSEARAWIDDVLAMKIPEILGAVVANWGAYLAAREADYDRAVALADTAKSVWLARGIPQGEAYALLVLGQVATELGDYDRADDLLRRSAKLFVDVGDEWGRVRPINSLGELARARGDLDAALAFHATALALTQTVGDAFWETNVLCGTAVVLAELDRPDEALACAAHALELALVSQIPAHVPAAVEAAALALADTDPPDVPVRLWAAAQDRRELVGAPMEPRDRPAFDRALRRARDALGQERFLAEWNAGRALTDTDLARILSHANETPPPGPA